MHWLGLRLVHWLGLRLRSDFLLPKISYKITITVDYIVDQRHAAMASFSSRLVRCLWTASPFVTVGSGYALYRDNERTRRLLMSGDIRAEPCLPAEKIDAISEHFKHYMASLEAEEERQRAEDRAHVERLVERSSDEMRQKIGLGFLSAGVCSMICFVAAGTLR